MAHVFVRVNGGDTITKAVRNQATKNAPVFTPFSRGARGLDGSAQFCGSECHRQSLALSVDLVHDAVNQGSELI